MHTVSSGTRDGSYHIRNGNDVVASVSDHKLGETVVWLLDAGGPEALGELVDAGMMLCSLPSVQAAGERFEALAKAVAAFTAVTAAPPAEQPLQEWPAQKLLDEALGCHQLILAEGAGGPATPEGVERQTKYGAITTELARRLLAYDDLKDLNFTR